ncbi:hypothetical protein [Mesorhizobium sp. M1348]|uniref:hypothetical protein n=1 Tax=unclassified Mesorhizobium TaxID=325217 RepID=UPI00333750AF
MKNAEEARANTLSARHGVNSFPHHSDFAFRPFPPRLIILINETQQSYETPTNVTRIIDLPKKMQDIHARSQWHLRVRGMAFVVGGMTAVGKHLIHRWDTDFLEPENGEAWACLQIIKKLVPRVESPHKWKPKSALLIDNWNCTHSRGYAKGGGENRELVRLEAWHHAGVDH